MPSGMDFLCGGERRVPKGLLPALDPRPAWLRPPATGLRAAWLGHPSVLIEIDSFRVLTDPVWGPRASPSKLAGPKRFQPAPVALRGLPARDLVVSLGRAGQDPAQTCAQHRRAAADAAMG